MENLTFKDFKSDQEVRWCPGCGDHAILAALQRTLPKVSGDLGYDREKFVVVSGIGCSSRLPYYMNTYGFHSIHGRATAISTGIKVANPELSVWQACGDGDALAIGGNHFIHAIRRNVDINVMLFNNRIYGLTKGQYSPTSKLGAITKTSPYGTVEHPFNPGSLVLGAKGTFFARSLDVELALNSEIMSAAALHKGCSVMEFLTNCVIFNDGAHKSLSDPALKAEHTIVLRHGEKMLFGKDKGKGLVYENGAIKSVTIGEDGYTIDDILVHDAHCQNPVLHMALVDMKEPDCPVALGIIRDVADISYDDEVRKQVEKVAASAKIHSVDELLRSGSTWEVK
ncbi:MAG: 2-oxoacid:ferredoxin oxidoreductase subunit beta [Bacteroidales bacterium]|nr:2-oxoacid:ferredoxin oxidoreductase subunit beta [Bacteroidales bacterium]